MKIYLEQNGGTDSSTVPYFANIEISTMTVDFNTNYMVPIKQHVNGSTTYRAEVCGFDVAADSPEATVSLVEKLVQELVNLARLPTYVFIARRSHKMYPVYTFKDEVFATTPGGPVFRHVELAKVREYLSDYMHTIGQLGTPGKSETLHVRGIHRKSLGLLRPIFYLKKRPEGDDSNEFWAPVFPSQDGQLIYTYAVNGRREVDIDNGHEILLLRSQVAQALIADGRLKEDFDLRADRLLPEYWEKVVAHLDPLPSKLTFNNTKLDMYKEGKYIIAVEYRTDEDRYSFYIGKGVDDLRSRAAKDLFRRKLISSQVDVKVEGAA
jgi:hypothetical protein